MTVAVARELLYGAKSAHIQDTGLLDYYYQWHDGNFTMNNRTHFTNMYCGQLLLLLVIL
jgi:hypothetical protein